MFRYKCLLTSGTNSRNDVPVHFLRCKQCSLTELCLSLFCQTMIAHVKYKRLIFYCGNAVQWCLLQSHVGVGGFGIGNKLLGGLDYQRHKVHKARGVCFVANAYWQVELTAEMIFLSIFYVNSSVWQNRVYHYSVKQWYPTSNLRDSLFTTVTQYSGTSYSDMSVQEVRVPV